MRLLVTMVIIICREIKYALFIPPVICKWKRYMGNISRVEGNVGMHDVGCSMT